jgi:TPP-dependent pyruvate/acetoin dehydrogenase alpha subunit
MADPTAQEPSVETLWRLYRTMALIRSAEETIANMVESKEVRCPCHLYIGQEAIATGVCAALRTDDYVWGGHRSHGHYLAKGGSLKGMIAEILGKVTGCSKGRGGSMHLFAREVGILGTVPLVAATIPLAAGSALASKLRRDGRVSVAFFGDGATEEGHFHESVNIAAVYRLPVIFICENNFYSSHMGLLERRREDNIYKSGEAHGIPGIQVDGNNVLEVLSVALKAVDRARNESGPTLLECRTFRWRGHVGPSWDMDVGVKRKDELKDWLPKDPLKRLGDLLTQRGARADEFDRVSHEIRSEVEDAVRFARQSPFPNVEELTRHVYFSEDGLR